MLKNQINSLSEDEMRKLSDEYVSELVDLAKSIFKVLN
jgi:hypothetical protein